MPSAASSSSSNNNNNNDKTKSFASPPALRLPTGRFVPAFRQAKLQKAQEKQGQLLNAAKQEKPCLDGKSSECWNHSSSSFDDADDLFQEKGSLEFDLISCRH